MMARRVRQALARVGDETAGPARPGASAESNPAAIDVDAVRRRVAAASGTPDNRGRDARGARPGDRATLGRVVRVWAPRVPVVLAVLALVAVALAGGSDSGRERLEDDVDEPGAPVTAGDGLPDESSPDGDRTSPDPRGSAVPVP